MGKHLPKLTWQPDKNRKAGGRWYLIHNRKHKFFNGGGGKTDRENYRKQQEVAAEWLANQGVNREHARYDLAILKREQLIEFMELSGQVDEPLKKRVSKELQQLRKQAKLKTPPPLMVNLLKSSPSEIQLDPLTDVDDASHWQRGIAKVKAHQQWSNTATKEKDTIEKHGRDFIATKRRATKIGEIEPSTFKTIYERLEHFLKWAGSKPVQELEKTLLTRWKGELEDRVIGESKHVEEPISTRYAANLLNVAKTFTNQLYEDEVIDKLPRAWKSLSIAVTQPEVVVFTKPEVKRLLDNATERTKFFILLMLNCGYYPADIADVKSSEIDWKQGRIKRKRKKTKKRGSVPVVDHLLWDETFELLKKYGSPNSTFAILNAEGNPLVKREFNGKGSNVGYTNNIALAWDYLQRVKLELPKAQRKQMMSLRKTSSDLMAKSKEHGSMAQHFLGQAPRVLIDQRYKVNPDRDDFDQAVIWLGEQFNQKTER
ncbi:tyrosine-type recombinase/integrase [Bremerella sp. P1]|uniref:tyrosine-type recombinase/integrase n=1 Tax=Bremerella sp. P1 TaxID=3026424 RepID=UPI0023680447|nr:tyrosine-type recombinase/integrase [Bremerella sp. P1]WDI41844.1 tyrosine-type recombinase/integrase [Bremerella sp. P1]